MPHWIVDLGGELGLVVAERLVELDIRPQMINRGSRPTRTSAREKSKATFVPSKGWRRFVHGRDAF